MLLTIIIALILSVILGFILSQLIEASVDFKLLFENNQTYIKITKIILLILSTIFIFIALFGVVYFIFTLKNLF